MSLEIRMLAWSIVLGIVQLLLASAWASSERGLKWNAGPRDGTSVPLRPVAGRAERASHNFLETFPFFAAAVLAVVATGRTGALSAVGVQLYFWARLVYVPLYLGGVPWVRSLVWAVSMAGLALVLWAVLGGVSGRP